MRYFRPRAAATLLVLFCATGAQAQQSQPTTAVPEAAAARNTGSVPNTGAVPNVIRFSGSFRPSNGMPAQPVESVTLSVYRDQTGGTPLWQETQNVVVDGEGKYSVLMGSTQNDGVPMDLLSAGEPRWLGAQFNRPGEPEQPRVLMASVPYALKSVDAETLGGKPASAYLLARAGAANTTDNGVLSSSEMAGHGAAPPSTTVGATTSGVQPRTISGTQNFIPYFIDGSNDLGNSVIQEATGTIGIGTVPGANAGTQPSLDLRTQPFSQIGMAQTTDYLTFFSSDTYGPAIYWNPGKDMRFGKGGTSLYNAFGFTEQMRIQSATGNVGIGTLTPAAKLEVNGAAQVDGNVTITTTGNGLIFPDGSKQTTAAGGGGGGGSVTGVTAGTDLTGGGTSGIVTVSLDTTKVPTLAGANTFAATNTFTGAVSAGSLTVTGTAQAANLVATQNVNFSGSVLYQGGPVLQVCCGLAPTNITLGLGLGNTSSGGANTAVGYRALPGGSVQSANTGGENTAMGTFAMFGNTAGSDNTGIGYEALSGNTSGGNNVAVGYNALENYSTTNFNTAVGAQALQGGFPASSDTGIQNTAVGYNALQNNTSGGNNTATGATALQLNSTGIGNTAVGVAALSNNDTGSGNTAVGFAALGNSTATVFFDGLFAGNTAVGYQALQGNVNTSLNTGAANTATGLGALEDNTSGNENTAHGYGALGSNTTGGQNTAIGGDALGGNTMGSGNTGIGAGALSGNITGNNNIAIGGGAGLQVNDGDSNNIDIGNEGASGDSGIIRVGTPGTQTAFVAAGIYGVNLGGSAVSINSNGQLSSPSSSRRYKEGIHDMDDASRGLMDLRPVTFRYKKAAEDGSKPLQYGLIAEEVAEVYPELVVYKDGQPDAVQYQVLPSMLLNEMQKQNQRAEQQDETIRHQQGQVLQQQEQIKKLEARLAALEAMLSGKGPTVGAAGR